MSVPEKPRDIASLHPFNATRVSVCAKVTDRTPVREFKKGNGYYFAATLVDATGSIRATFFKGAVDRYKDLVLVGNAFQFKNGSVRAARAEFNPVQNPYEMVFDDAAEIVPHEDFSLGGAAELRSFLPIEKLKSRAAGCVVDVLALVVNVSRDVGTVTTRNNEEVKKRVVTIADTTATVDLTVWGETAERWGVDEGTVVAFKQLRVGRFQQAINLSLTQLGAIEVLRTSDEENFKNLPELHKRVQGLEDFYGDYNRNPTSIPNLSALTQATGTFGPGNPERRLLADIEGLGLGTHKDNQGVTKPDWLTVRGHILAVKRDGLVYLAHPENGRKLDTLDADFNRAEPRYLAAVQFADATRHRWVTAFHDVAKNIFPVAAADMKKIADADAKEREAAQAIQAIQEKEGQKGLGAARVGRRQQTVLDKVCYRPVVIKIRAKEEVIPERAMDMATQGSQRDAGPRTIVKLAAQWAEPLDTKTQGWKRECNLMLRDIQRYSEMA